MQIYEAIKNDLIISTDKSKLDVNLVHNYLSRESYWAKNIPLDVVEKSIAGSFCFGLYVQQQNNILNENENLYLLTQIGFARVITDHATFAYLADVFIVEEFRGKGLSKWLMQTIMDNSSLQGLRRWLLATKDAHTLYAKFGFTALDKPERVMGLKPFEEYPKSNS